MLKRRKKIMIKVLFLAMCTSLAPTTIAFAETNEKENGTNIVQTTGVAVSVNQENTTEEEVTNELVNSSVTNESDFEFDEATGMITEYTGDDTEVIIPSTIDGVKVTSIKKHAFRRSEELISITIPESITSIGDYTFENCFSLEEINVDSNNKNYTSIDGVLFNKSKTKMIKYPEGKTETTYKIPSSVTDIVTRAFMDADNLISITIPSSVVNISDNSIESCSDLEEINVDSNNKNYISVDGILFNKSKTKIIKYPEEKTGTTYTIPSSVTDIAEEAFCDVSNLTSVTIPASVTNIETYSFSWCDDLQNINVNSNNKNYTSVDGILFNKSKTKIIQYPTGKTATTYTIPSTVISIGEDVFEGCENLSSVIIPSSVTSIGDYAFYYCDNLTSITIPNSVKSIGEDAFGDCDKLTSITIPSSVTSIGDYAFEDCDNLTSVTIASSVTSIGEDAFYYCKNAKFYVKSEKVKKLLINSGVDSSKITLNSELSTSKVTSVKLNKTSLSVVKGKTATLTATVAPSTATNKAVTWSSSNAKVATVDVNGKITGIAAGSATIKCTASDGSGKSTTCAVTVTKTSTVSATSVTLKTNKLSLLVGKTGSLTATVLPSTATNKALTWKSSNTKVATVDANGKVTGITAGIATITCTTSDGSGKSATCALTVTKGSTVSVTKVTLNKSTLSVIKGKASTLIATVAPTTATNKAVTWSSSNTKIATVDAKGKITGVAAGTANITCTTKDGSKKTAICKVTVTNPVNVTSVKLNKTSLSVIKGKTATLTTIIAPSTATNKAVTWKSSNIKIATVDANGKITGVAAGTANITCTTQDGSKKTATCKVTVTK